MSPGGCGPGSNSGGDPWSNGGGGTWPGGGSSGNYGDACWSSSECSSNLCVQSSCSGALFCTKACNSDADCGGTACVGTNVAGLYVCSEGGGGTAPPPQNPAPTPPPTPAPPQGDVTPPRVLILSPSNKTVVAPQLSLEANATDDVAVTQVDLYIDGVLAATSSAAPYSFPVQLARGTHVLKVVARDAAGNQGSAQTMVGVTQDPTPAAPSPAAPAPAPALLGYGAVCGGPADCQSGLCAHDGASNRRFCTQACNAAALCPTGSGCFSVTAGPSICAPTSGPLEGTAPTRPTAEDSVGFAGCSVGPNGKASPFMLTTLMLLGLAVLLRRRQA